MYCNNCGAEITGTGNFCPYCGARLETATLSGQLISKAASTAQSLNRYNLILISRGNVDAVTAGDLLEDVFGYTDAESGAIIKMVPVVVGENLTAEEAATIAQLYTEYGMEVSVTDENDQFVNLPCISNSSLFDANGSLLAGVSAVIGALTVANRIRSYRRYKKPSLAERIFHINYAPAPLPMYRRSFRPRLDMDRPEPRKTIRRPAGEFTGPFGVFGMNGKPEPRRNAPKQEPMRQPEPQRQAAPKQERKSSPRPKAQSQRGGQGGPQGGPGANGGAPKRGRK